MSVDLVVVGLGYVGLPLAREATLAGLNVRGLDLSSAVVDGLNERRSHVDDLSDQDIAEMVSRGFVATADESVLDEARTVVICVPTPLAEDGSPDLGAVTGAAATIGRHLQRDTLVVLESTTYPGTTDDVVRPILEAGSGLRAGESFALAFSPERIDPGNATFGLRNTPKVVGGYTSGCSRRAREFYAAFIERVIVAKGTREAETAKLLENTYRHVNIALVNEMVKFCHDLRIDLWDVINLASTKPFGFQAFRPGPGVGGHCIPIDPNYLSHHVRSELGYSFRFVELAEEINSGMPGYVARRAQDILNADRVAINGATVLLLGVTYKPNIADERESPAVPLARALQELGAKVVYHDPYVGQWEAAGTARVDDPITAGAEAELTILVQDHAEYDVVKLARTARRFFDTRGTDAAGENVRRL